MCFSKNLDEIEEMLDKLENSSSVSDIRSGIIETILNLKIKEDEFYEYKDYDLYEDEDINRLKKILKLWIKYVRRINNNREV